MISYMLGTRPDEFGLVPDREGYIPIKEFLKAIHEEPHMAYVRESHVREVLLHDRDGIFEIDGKRVRSTRRAFRLLNERKGPTLPPKILFAGVKRKAYPAVLDRGLLPGSKQYVVMARDRDLAIRIAHRLDEKPIILEITARKATEDGIDLLPFGDSLYLAEGIPVRYISGPPLPKQLPPGEEPSRRETEPSPGSIILRADRDPDLRRRERVKKRIGWKDEVKRGRKRKRAGLEKSWLQTSAGGIFWKTMK